MSETVVNVESDIRISGRSVRTHPDRAWSAGHEGVNGEGLTTPER
jgi:hypothetical protein